MSEVYIRSSTRCKRRTGFALDAAPFAVAAKLFSLWRVPLEPPPIDRQSKLLHAQLALRRALFIFL